MTVSNADAALDDRPDKALSSARDDVIDGCAQLYGGYGGEPRAAAGNERWARIAHFGPAFFIKLLYFATNSDALILDNVLAHRAHELNGLPKLLDNKGQARAWSPYRYAVYLHWMKQTTERHRSAGVSTASPDLSKYTLFSRPESSEEDYASE